MSSRIISYLSHVRKKRDAQVLTLTIRYQSLHKRQISTLNAMEREELTLVSATKIHQKGYCAFYGDCGLNPEVSGSLIPAFVPCVSNTPARKLNGANLTVLKAICPMLYNGDNDTYSCCSSLQLDNLKKSLSLSRAILSRCPSCAENFANSYCQNICSPDQSVFTNVTRTFHANISGQSLEGVLHYQCYYNQKFADDTFSSCRNVRMPATGGYAIEAMCGKYGAHLCTTQRWLDYQGDSSNGVSPLDISFKLIDNRTIIGDGIVPFSSKVWKCSEAFGSEGEPCSCLDCTESCPAIPSPSPKPSPFKIGELDGSLVICILVFFILVLAFLGYLISRFCTSSKNKVKLDEKQHVVGKKGITCSEKLSLSTQNFLSKTFRRWGIFVASHPFSTISVSLIIVAVLSAGNVFIKLTTDPVELWSSPKSQARQEKDFHDANFGPFMRTNQVIITVVNRTSYMYDSLFFGSQNFSGILSDDILLELLELQIRLQNIKVWSDKHQVNITLKDVCYAPLNPTNASSDDCCVNSLMQYFQNNRTRFELQTSQIHLGQQGKVTWRDHFLYCVNSPLSFRDITDLQLSCMADYGAPVFPFLAVGGYEDVKYSEANALILTISLNNYPRSDPRFEYVLLWEKRFIEILKEYQQNPSSNFTYAFMSERSLEDEINRTSLEDIPIFTISYFVIFLYIALALGEYSSCKRVLVDSKITLGLGGILVVLGSVLSSMGFYSYLGIPSSLIIVEVVPFLVLAVGADNIFIFVLEYQRSERKAGERREEHIGRVLGSVAPSMLLCSTSESICFFLGALSQMPAVRTFALNAALAVLLDFLLQMSMFIALVSLDARRQEDSRFDICCCVKMKEKKVKKASQGLLLPFMEKFYAPLLLNSFMRVLVMLVFIFMFCAGIFLTLHVQVGLDQELAMPKDSYMVNYFKYLNQYFEVGVPTYFVTMSGYDFSNVEGINGVCSSVGCNNNSLTQKIQYAVEFPELSYLKIPASSWVDDFIDWLNPMSDCCRLYLIGPNKDQFCPSTDTSLNCIKKCMKVSNGIVRPNIDEFNKYLPLFLEDLPNLKCPKGGLGAYDGSVKRGDNGEIIASRFMAYHTPLTNSQQYTAALKAARELAANITKSMRNVPGTDPNFTVFPYSITYVYYEQYLTIVNEGLFNLSLCLIPTFVVCCILLGMDLRSGFINLITIIMIVVDTVGVMTLWSIDYNAVSLINLVTAVGISVEFVSHLTRSFAMSTKPSKVKRAKEATVYMGSAVFAGVAMTNLPGIVVLAFAKAQLIQIFFFRLNLTITLLGMVHGLIFLPVVLSYFGPETNQAMLLEIQQEEAKESQEAPGVIAFYNIGFEEQNKPSENSIH
ncbi:NPC1-like intracellular cholesterol transporter 1 [Microcaecilia unicolor]|uniref:NPC1-like intracellular cholesterol transporter 1 n=1 Tax=Microcaecilia unicolor TaxID=1415580 RepID=A0A6P7Y6I3_9AMPH|nr:NPC1-like intracellular cholesterol transporter 1 [Microcaecilia unicolor]